MRRALSQRMYLVHRESLERFLADDFKGALLLVSALLAKAPALGKLELNGNALDDAALEKLGELLGDRDILGDMDDNDEDLADDDCLDDGGLDGLDAALGAVGI